MRRGPINKPFVPLSAPRGGGGPGFFRERRSPGPVGVSGPRLQVSIPTDETGRLLLAAQLALPKLPSEIREQVASLLTLESFAMLSAGATILAGSQLIGVGEAVDVVFVGITVGFMGWDAIEACRSLLGFWETARHARNEKDIENASGLFAQAIVLAGNDLLLFFLGRRVASRSVATIRAAEEAEILARWEKVAAKLTFEVPANKGMLWSKLGGTEAAIQEAKGRKLVCLEQELKDKGMLKAIDAELPAWSDTKKRIFDLISRQYAESLRGEVTAVVNTGIEETGGGRVVFKKGSGSARPMAYSISSETHRVNISTATAKEIEESQLHLPAITVELEEIAEVMDSNPGIVRVKIIDRTTGRTWHMVRGSHMTN